MAIDPLKQTLFDMWMTRLDECVTTRAGGSASKV